MNKITNNIKTLPAFSIFIVVATLTAPALAQDANQNSPAPHTFAEGDVISADQMNDNFIGVTEALEAMQAQIDRLRETTAPTVKDAGVFAGSVETKETGGDFSLLPGTDGATGVDAADAACEVLYPGSHAELDQLAIFKAGASLNLPVGEYWVSGEADMIVNNNNYQTNNCENWSTMRGYSSETGSGALGNVVIVRPTETTELLSYITIQDSYCAGGIVKIACFKD